MTSWRARTPFACASSRRSLTRRISARRCSSLGSAHWCPLQMLHQTQRMLHSMSYFTEDAGALRLCARRTQRREEGEWFGTLFVTLFDTLFDTLPVRLFRASV
eukprot:6893429-Pyramimonas_sp.AAC.1